MATFIGRAGYGSSACVCLGAPVFLYDDEYISIVLLSTLDMGYDG